ncbi:hypothetical protein [Actinoplanes sp. M2I2]|uniref:hypothetical protein n=1 Tax=Actinoplanes sp. M2I2 TaxID=1734444 RepID=UPI0020222C69|nr:hypothetical protein [Actinoplanes sp. M2I2]
MTAMRNPTLILTALVTGLDLGCRVIDAGVGRLDDHAEGRLRARPDAIGVRR